MECLREGWYLLIISFVAIMLALSGEYIAEYYKYDGSLYVESYKAYLSPDGNLTEKYEYVVKGDYRYLYRTWNAPLLYNENFSNPFIKILKIEGPCIRYVKDYYGVVYASDYVSTIKSEAYINEAGCFCPDGYERGKYEITYEYVIYPPVEYDNKFYHINIKLADKHVPYRNVEIHIDNSSGSIAKVYLHPPMNIVEKGSEYVFLGSSQRNGLIEVEMLLYNATPKFAKYVDDIEEKTVSANDAYYAKYSAASWLAKMMKAIVFLFPGIIAVIYYFKGREKKFVVPKYLSFIPKKRRPWLVNLVFKKDALDFDMDGFYATLLDMHRRGIIEIESEGKDVKIRFGKHDLNELDEYEKKVILFLKKYSSEGVFSTEKMKEKIKMHKGDLQSLTKIKEDFKDILDVKGGDHFITNGRKLMAKFFIASLLAF
ncbi:MAG TPA: DUF2207 domain-containing protein, partial [Thermoplasmatales archaeon]|nr:DUF2207 domain-containing protein [Thermoplasmatales archaeon]